MESFDDSVIKHMLPFTSGKGKKCHISLFVLSLYVVTFVMMCREHELNACQKYMENIQYINATDKTGMAMKMLFLSKSAMFTVKAAT